MREKMSRHFSPERAKEFFELLPNRATQKIQRNAGENRQNSRAVLGALTRPGASCGVCSRVLVMRRVEPVALHPRRCDLFKIAHD